MQSRWYDKKVDAIELRKNGVSIRTIEKSLGISRSTLSNWFKDVTLTSTQKAKLSRNQLGALVKAREKALEWHHSQKLARLKDAENAAADSFNKLRLTPQTLDLALAMLYLGEGRKKDSTSIGNSDPMVLRFVLTVLRENYKLNIQKISCELHLRADQDAETVKQYWSEQLSIPIENFKRVYIDKRTEGKPTYESYHGVCLLNYGRIDIQRKLIYLYNQFCKEVINSKGM